jgi:hypothetical protein
MKIMAKKVGKTISSGVFAKAENIPIQLDTGNAVERIKKLVYLGSPPVGLPFFNNPEKWN